jgi:serine protease Do
MFSDIKMKSSKNTFCLLLVFFLCSTLIADNSTYSGPEGLSLAFRQAVKKVRPAVVYIEVVKSGEGNFLGQRATGSGSGVIIDAKAGYVLTANHVIEGTTQVKIRLFDGRTFLGTDIRGDAQTDVAIVKIDAENLPGAEFGDSDRLEVGDWVLAIGSPFGPRLENSVSAGIVSGKGRRTGILGSLGLEDYIQTDAVINRGNSGGPLVNIKGEIVGINSSIISSTGMYAGLGFAVPSNLANSVVEGLIKEGKVVRGWLGITMVSMRDAKSDEKLKEQWSNLHPQTRMPDKGAYILKIHPDSPAEKGGLREGDIVQGIDETPIADSGELIKVISSRSPREIVDCHIWRDGNKETVKVELGKRPEIITPESMGIAKKPGPLGTGYNELGLIVEDFTGLIAERMGLSELKAVIVEAVQPGSLAYAFGINPGEIITNVNGKRVRQTTDLEKLLKKGDLNKGIKLTILNAFGEREVIVKSGAD